MGLFNLLGIPSLVAPISSFIELVISIHGNKEDEKEMDSEDVVNDIQDEKKMRN